MKKSNIPFVSSWGGISYFDHRLDNYYGHIGVYGNRGRILLFRTVIIC